MEIPRNHFCVWWRIINAFVSTRAIAFRTTYGQNNTHKCDNGGFVHVASLCGVFVSPSSFIISLIGRTGSIWSVVYINAKLTYTSGSANQRSYKRGLRYNNVTQTGKRYETFSIPFTCVILSMCCTESYGAYWDKDVKHSSSSAKTGLRYLCWDSKESKRISCVRTQYKEDNIFRLCCVWRKFNVLSQYAP